MLRTRDFLLYALVVLFLLIAIGATIFLKQPKNSNDPSVLLFTETTQESYSAKVYEEQTLSREERVAQMRQKVSESRSLVLSESNPSGSEEQTTVLANDMTDGSEETSEEEPSDEETEEAAEEGAVLLSCPGYREYAGYWPRNGVKVETVEGARLVYTEEIVEQVVATTTIIETQKNVLLQLPLRLGPGSVPNCLATDVIGVATDGSLIRNTESGLYGVFGQDTLVGYALDGFPIYGLSSQRPDACGGALVSGQYRYYLSAEREVILNCFSAPAVSLP